MWGYIRSNRKVKVVNNMPDMKDISLEVIFARVDSEKSRRFKDQFERRVWENSVGVEVPIDDMNQTYLTNCINFLKLNMESDTPAWYKIVGRLYVKEMYKLLQDKFNIEPPPYKPLSINTSKFTQKMKLQVIEELCNYFPEDPLALSILKIIKGGV